MRAKYLGPANGYGVNMEKKRYYFPKGVLVNVDQKVKEHLEKIIHKGEPCFEINITSHSLISKDKLDDKHANSKSEKKSNIDTDSSKIKADHKKKNSKAKSSLDKIISSSALDDSDV